MDTLETGEVGVVFSVAEVTDEPNEGVGATDGDVGPGSIGDAITSGPCTSDAECADGQECTDDVCGADGVCTHIVAAGSCYTDGICVALGEVHPTNSCEVCETPGTDFPWGYEHQASCDDGDPCTPVSFCNKDTCQGVFAGSCCGNGTLEPGEACDDGNTVDQDGCPSTCKVPAQRIAGGSEHTCALLGDSSVICWGLNDEGQATPPSGPFVSISAGVNFSCGIRPEGALECWGANEHGQSTPPEGEYLMIESGQYQACALGVDGLVKCWGWDRHGCISDAPAFPFLDIGSLESTNCGVTDDEVLHCWGDSQLNKLSDMPSGSFVGMAGGTFHSMCAVRTDQTVACWGGKNGGLPSPAGAFTHIAVGTAHGCGVRVDGTLVCWGTNDAGQSSPPAGGQWTQVACGGWGSSPGHSCALDVQGAILCWGDNGKGQSSPP